MSIDRAEPSRRGVLKFGAGASLAAALPPLAAAKADVEDRAAVFANRVWRRRLSIEAYDVLRVGAMEFPYSSELHDEDRDGLYVCGGCARPLFASVTKYGSGTGWPSFTAPLAGAFAIGDAMRHATGGARLQCPQCSGHLGYVFDDGPRPSGRRYCINGAAMSFHAASGV